MIRIEHEHSKIIYRAFCFKIKFDRMIYYNSQGKAEKINTRHSFTKESKLKVVQFFYNHDKNCNQTATYF